MSIFSIIFSSFFSSSTSCRTKIGDLIKEFNGEPIKSFVIGISRISFHFLNRNIAHVALFLTTKNRKDLLNNKSKNTEGILLEYGDYPSDEPKAKAKEEYRIKNGFVIYRYGEKGGLRYYTNTFEYFEKNFCDVGYIPLNISQNNHKTFSELIDILAPESENKWIKENYNPVSIIKKSQNSQDFASHVIDILKPSSYEAIFITPGKEFKPISDRESLVPDSILKTLQKYE